MHELISLYFLQIKSSYKNSKYAIMLLHSDMREVQDTSHAKDITLSSAISCSRFANVTMNAASFFFAFSNW